MNILVKQILKETEIIQGGLADNKTLNNIALKHQVSLEHIKTELNKGVKVEKEHTNDIKIAYEIAKDHLMEDPNYYSKLKTIEK